MIRAGVLGELADPPQLREVELNLLLPQRRSFDRLQNTHTHEMHMVGSDHSTFNTIASTLISPERDALGRGTGTAKRPALL